MASAGSRAASKSRASNSEPPQKVEAVSPKKSSPTEEAQSPRSRLARHASFVTSSGASTLSKQLSKSPSSPRVVVSPLPVEELPKSISDGASPTTKKRAQSLVVSRGVSNSNPPPVPRVVVVDRRESSVERTRAIFERAHSAEPSPSSVPSSVPLARAATMRTKSVAVTPKAAGPKPEQLYSRAQLKPLVKKPATLKTASGSVLRYTSESKQWQETLMSIAANGAVTFGTDAPILTLRPETAIMFWSFANKTEKQYRIQLVDTTELVLQVVGVANFEKWVKCLENHGCIIQRPIKEGSLVMLKDKTEAYFVLFPDSLKLLKQASDASFVRSVRLEDGGFLEYLENDSFCLWEAGDESANSIALCADDAWREAIELALSTKGQKKIPNSLREGFLWRNLKKKIWQRQYCVLTHEGFYYFDTKAAEQSAGFVNLPPIADADSVLETDASSISRKNSFWLVENGDEYPAGHRIVFSAQSAKDREKWLSTLFTSLENKQTRVNLLSIKEGYLYKRATGGKWSRKFFVLLMDQLLYLAKRTDTKFKAIDLNQGPEIAAVPTGGDVAGARSGVFSVAENGDESGTRTYFLQAKDDAARSQWLDVLKALVLTKDSRLNPLSIREGYLLKEQRDKKKWNKRYFVLLASNDTLIYLKKRNSASHSCEIPITGAAEITQIDDDNEHKFRFSIAENGDEVGTRTYHLSCDTALIRTQWVSAISKMIKSQVSRLFQDSILEDYLWDVRPGNPAKKLFFVLRPHQLLYFKKRNDPTQAGTIEIGDEAEIALIDGGVHPCMFSIQRSGDDDERVLKLYSQDSASRDEWVNALRKQVQAGKKESTTSLREGYVFLWDSGSWRKKYFILEPASLSLLTKRKDQTPHIKIDLNENTTIMLSEIAAKNEDEKHEVSKYGSDIQILIYTGALATTKPIRLRTKDDTKAFSAILIELCIRSEFPVADDRNLKWGYLSVRDRTKTEVWTPHYVIVTKNRLWCFKTRGDEFPMCLVSLEDTTQLSISEVDGSLQLHDASEREVHVMFQSNQEQQSWLPAIMQSIATRECVRHDLFGTSLSAALRVSPFYNMPAVVVLCLQFLIDSSISVSLLQHAASHATIRSFMQDFENSLDVMLIDPPSVVALLRLYLIMLKEPIIADETCTNLIEAVKKRENQSAMQTQVQELLSRLDVNNTAVLNALLHYFRRELSREPPIACGQLANTWAPVLMRKGTEQEISAVLSELIINLDAYFPNATYAVRKLEPDKLRKLQAESKILTLDQVLHDKAGMGLFLQFATETFMPENVNFLLAVGKYRAQCLAPRPNRSLCIASATAICRDFIEPGAKLQLNVSSALCTHTLGIFRPKPPPKLTGTEFLPIESEVNVLLLTNEFPRFRASVFWDHWITYRRSKSRELKLPKVITSAQQMLLRNPKDRKHVAALTRLYESKAG